MLTRFHIKWIWKIVFYYPEQCDICLKNFKSARILRGHQKIHAERQFICDVCNKKFNRRYHLTLHMKRHGKTSTKSKKAAKKWITVPSLFCKSILVRKYRVLWKINVTRKFRQIHLFTFIIIIIVKRFSIHG